MGFTETKEIDQRENMQTVQKKKHTKTKPDVGGRGKKLFKDVISNT